MTCMVRRSVPNDNSCLFYALAYLCEGAEPSPPVERRLRTIVADAVLADPDPETRAVFLGRPVAEYADWIRDTFHWGGENEIVVLAKHYGVEVAVVSCETMGVLVYGQGGSVAGRIYVLYTGQHYDPLVGAAGAHVPVSEETRRFGAGSAPEAEAAALGVARQHNEEAARRAKQRRVTRIKCGGCGALVEDAAAFQEHCGAVEHGDDFCYDCENVEVVVGADEEMPDGAVDLTDETKYYTFYNSSDYPFSNFYPATVEMPPGTVYPTAEHCWQAARYVDSVPELASKIRAASTIDEARTLAFAEGIDRQRPGWDDARYDVMVSIIRAKFAQHPELAQQLVASEGRELVSVDTDGWAGMAAAGGIATGHNNVGKALMQVRAELLTAAS